VYYGQQLNLNGRIFGMGNLQVLYFLSFLCLFSGGGGLGLLGKFFFWPTYLLFGIDFIKIRFGNLEVKLLLL